MKRIFITLFILTFTLGTLSSCRETKEKEVDTEVIDTEDMRDDLEDEVEELNEEVEEEMEERKEEMEEAREDSIDD